MTFAKIIFSFGLLYWLSGCKEESDNASEATVDGILFTQANLEEFVAKAKTNLEKETWIEEEANFHFKNRACDEVIDSSRYPECNKISEGGDSPISKCFQEKNKMPKFSVVGNVVSLQGKASITKEDCPDLFSNSGLFTSFEIVNEGFVHFEVDNCDLTHIHGKSVLEVVGDPFDVCKLKTKKFIFNLKNTMKGQSKIESSTFAATIESVSTQILSSMNGESHCEFKVEKDIITTSNCQEYNISINEHKVIEGSLPEGVFETESRYEIENTSEMVGSTVLDAMWFRSGKREILGQGGWNATINFNGDNVAPSFTAVRINDGVEIQGNINSPQNIALKVSESLRLQKHAMKQKFDIFHYIHKLILKINHLQDK